MCSELRGTGDALELQTSEHLSDITARNTRIAREQSAISQLSFDWWNLASRISNISNIDVSIGRIDSNFALFANYSGNKRAKLWFHVKNWFGCKRTQYMHFKNTFSLLMSDFRPIISVLFVSTLQALSLLLFRLIWSDILCLPLIPISLFVVRGEWSHSQPVLVSLSLSSLSFLVLQCITTSVFVSKPKFNFSLIIYRRLCCHNWIRISFSVRNLWLDPISLWLLFWSPILIVIYWETYLTVVWDAKPKPFAFNWIPDHSY